MQKSKQPTFAQPSSVRTKASDFNHWLLKAPELGQPRLHTTSGSWPVQRQPGKEKMLLPARHSFYKSFASLPAVSAVGQFCVTGPNSPALRALTLPDRLLPCFWLLILDASFVPLHVHKHLRPSRRPSESSWPLTAGFSLFWSLPYGLLAFFFHALQWTAAEVSTRFFPCIPGHVCPPAEGLWLWQLYLWKITIYSEFSHEKWWFSIVMIVYQRVTCRWKPASKHVCDDQVLIFRRTTRGISCRYSTTLGIQHEQHAYISTYIIIYPHISTHTAYL